MVPFSEATKRMQQVAEAVERVIIGKTRSVRLAVTALFAGGHLLIEDIPGVGKTTLAKRWLVALAAHSSEFSSPLICFHPT